MIERFITAIGYKIGKAEEYMKVTHIIAIIYASLASN
jgi:hypothetical protein